MEIIEPNHSKVHFCSQEEVVQRMKENGCYEKFEELSRQGRRELIDFCTGKTLLPLTYDKIFKKVFNCEKHPERLEHFLSSILGFEVKILTILPTESEQMNKEGSILIMDILVKSTDGKLLNVEMQRLPYSFNGKRVSCYMADLVMRQYNQIKSELKRKKFTYSMLKPVYCIVLFEKSGGAMSDLPDIWEDRGKIVFDSGLEEEFLENIHYIELDKFRKNVQTITNEKECWLSLFSADTPEKIQQVMYNLIDNAIKFSHNDSVIYIQAAGQYEKIFVSVKDTGIGIPKDSLKKIWERFYKTDLSRGKDKKGTGLGLSIVKEILQSHGENIDVISTEGVGTEFIFSLPRSTVL